MQTISIVFHKDYFWPLEDFKNGAIGLLIIRQSFSIIVSFPQHLNIFFRKVIKSPESTVKSLSTKRNNCSVVCLFRFANFTSFWDNFIAVLKRVEKIRLQKEINIIAIHWDNFIEVLKKAEKYDCKGALV